MTRKIIKYRLNKQDDFAFTKYGGTFSIGDIVGYCLALADFEIDEKIYKQLPRIIQKKFTPNT